MIFNPCSLRGMRSLTTAMACLLLPLLLAACEGGMQQSLGLTRDAPDEFTVVSRPPLSLPPDFDLRPPSPGEEGPRVLDTQSQARSLLTGATPLGQAAGATASQPQGGAARLLSRAGADGAQADIRDVLKQDARTPVDTSGAKTLMEKLAGDEKREPTVDAAKETERLRENREAGKAINEGQVPETAPKSDALIDRIF
jgi:hypothetical protein